MGHYCMIALVITQTGNPGACVNIDLITENTHCRAFNNSTQSTMIVQALHGFYQKYSFILKTYIIPIVYIFTFANC